MYISIRRCPRDDIQEGHILTSIQTINMLVNVFSDNDSFVSQSVLIYQLHFYGKVILFGQV